MLCAQPEDVQGGDRKSAGHSRRISPTGHLPGTAAVDPQRGKEQAKGRGERVTAAAGGLRLRANASPGAPGGRGSLIGLQKAGEQRGSQRDRVAAERKVFELSELRYRGGVAAYLEPSARSGLSSTRRSTRPQASASTSTLSSACTRPSQADGRLIDYIELQGAVPQDDDSFGVSE